MKYKSLLRNLALGAILLSPLRADEMLYVGLTDTGWQVFHCDLVTMKQKQLTKSLGDKRTPIYSSAYKAVLYRGSKGRIWSVDSEGKESVLVDIIGCADFTVDGQDIYFTRLVTGNSKRQHLWKAAGERPFKEMELIYRPEKGSIRQPHFRDGKFLATHIWTVGEELVVVIDPNAQPVMSALTAPGELASYPRWINDQSAVFSYSINDQGNYDIYTVDVLSAVSSPQTSAKALLKGTEHSEFSCSLNTAEDLYYFERLDDKGIWSIASMDLEGESVTELPFKEQVKEPFVFKSE